MKIAFSGKMKSGKDFAAKYLKDMCPEYNFKIMALADSIKELALNEFGVTKDNHPKGREILQYIGTELGRNLVDEDIWIKRLLAKIDSNDNVLVTDVRFPNEVEALQKAGFNIVRIEADRIQRKKRGKLINQDHPSETALNDYFFTTTIFNNDTELQFQRDLDRLMIILNK